MICEWFRNMKVKVQYGGPGHLLLYLSYFRTMYDSLLFANDLRVCFFSHVKRSGNATLLPVCLLDMLKASLVRDFY